jgi:hypothetical protein
LDLIYQQRRTDVGESALENLQSRYRAFQQSMKLGHAWPFALVNIIGRRQICAFKFRISNSANIVGASDFRLGFEAML